MESYLMMLYVTLEQESALKNFFVEHGWAFCKPDLSVVTDKLGPVTARLSIASEEIDVSDTYLQKEQESEKLKEKLPASSETTVKQRGKRKTCLQRQPIKLPKQAKVVPSTSVTDADESDEPEEAAEPGEVTELHEVVEEQKQENVPDTNPTKRKVIVEMGDGRQIQIKIERERQDMVENEGVGKMQDNGEQVGGMINDAEEENSDGDDAQTWNNRENAGDTVVKSENEMAESSSISRMELSVDDAAPKHKRKVRGKGYRQYEISRLREAYNSVMETGVPIKTAAKMFNVPVTTLGDRVHNRVSIDVTKTGPGPVLNREEETKLTSHLIQLAKIGYGYTQVEVTRQASDLAIELGKRDHTKPFSAKWYLNYVARYSEENRVKTFTLPQQKRLSKREECISTYYNNLNSIAKEYKFTEAPERMYLIDEVEVDIPAGENCNNTLTAIGAGNAAGQNIPPYFVLVTGLSEENDQYFVRRSHLITQGYKTYFQSHFAKYTSSKDENEHILVLYDAHKVHFSVEMIEWAKKSQIVIFPIPPHTSHSFKTSINTVFQQIKTKFSQEYGDVAPYKHLTSATGVVDILKDIYESSVTSSALKESFSKSGIYPLQKSKIMCDFLKKEGIIS